MGMRGLGPPRGSPRRGACRWWSVGEVAGVDVEGVGRVAELIAVAVVEAVADRAERIRISGLNPRRAARPAFGICPPGNTFRKRRPRGRVDEWGTRQIARPERR